MRPGDRLPALSLVDPGTGRTESLRRPQRGATALLLLPPDPSKEALSYVETFASAAERMERWDARPLVVVEEPPESAGASTAAPVRIDARGSLRGACALEAGEAAVVLADRWGEVYEVCREEADALPDPGALEEWLRYIATQCPECGVRDTEAPGGWNPP